MAVVLNRGWSSIIIIGMVDDTQETRRGGPRTPFGPKDLPNKSHSLTKLGKKILASAAKRTGQSESNVVEWLIRRHGGEVKSEDFNTPDFNTPDLAKAS